jgi:hypothetical protein
MESFHLRQIEKVRFLPWRQIPIRSKRQYLLEAIEANASLNTCDKVWMSSRLEDIQSVVNYNAVKYSPKGGCIKHIDFDTLFPT